MRFTPQRRRETRKTHEIEDFMKSKTHEVEDLARMDCRRLQPPPVDFAPKRKTAMERFIHLANLALFRKRLTEPCDDARRQLLLKLLAEEEAREPAPEKELRPPLQSPDDRDRG